MSGLATKRINEIYAELKEKYGRSLGADLVALEILAIKHYLDELLDDKRKDGREMGGTEVDLPRYAMMLKNEGRGQGGTG